MNIGKTAMAVVAAASLVVVPTIAQAASANQSAASRLSVASAPVARSGAKIVRKNELKGGSIIIALLAAAAVIGAIVIAADGSNGPTSP